MPYKSSGGVIGGLDIPFKNAWVNNHLLNFIDIIYIGNNSVYRMASKNSMSIRFISKLHRRLKKNDAKK